MNQSQRQVTPNLRKVFLLLIVVLAVGFSILVLVFNSPLSYALDENNCLSCHGDPSLSKTDAQGRKISLYVNGH